MIPLFHSRQKQNYLLFPFHRKHKTTQMGGCVLVDIASDLLNSVKSFMFEWSGYFALPGNRNLAW
jgi:hypothetical protein